MKATLVCLLLTLLLVPITPWFGGSLLAFGNAGPQSNDTGKVNPGQQPATPDAKSDGNTRLPQPHDSEPARSNPSREDRLQIDTKLVSLTVTVTDPMGRSVTGLGNDHFEVYDDKVKQEIKHFSYEDAPISIGIVFDVSGSMTERLGRSVRALRRFIETSHEDDDYFLITFNHRPRLIQDFTTSADEIASHLTLVQPKGPTALYDAAYLAIAKAQEGRHAKKALLIISDGQDNHSRYSYEELSDRAKEADVQIYGMGITDPGDSLNSVGRSILEELTSMTGGRAFFPNANNEPELVEICTRIALELRKQYSIGFYPTDLTSEAKWHKLQVKVKAPKGVGRFSLSYKDGYRSFNR